MVWACQRESDFHRYHRAQDAPEANLSGEDWNRFERTWTVMQT